MKTKEYVVGIDIGGTNTVFGIVDASGNIVGRGSIKTQRHADFDDYLQELHDEIENIAAKNDLAGNIVGIGLGAPNTNYYTGEMVSPANLPWKGVIPIAKKVSAIFNGIPVKVTNDANAATLGEQTYGAAKGLNDFIMLTLGTGIGSGIVSNGKLIYGHDGFAGELGHIVVDRQNGRKCGCGRAGCLETYCSASGVVRTAKEMLRSCEEDSMLRELSDEDLDSKAIYDAAKSGDKLSQRIFEHTGRILGEALADIVAFSSPKAIILFGGLAQSGKMLLDPMKEAFEKSVLFIYKNKVEFKVSELKQSEAAILGASALGWEAYHS